MNIKIEYCAPCGYRKRADTAAAALKEHHGITAELAPGKGGVFRVYADGEEIIARTKGHFPSADEIVTAVADCMSKNEQKRDRGRYYSAVRNIGNSWMFEERANQGRLPANVGELIGDTFAQVLPAP